MAIRQNTYYLGLFDLSIIDKITNDGINLYKKVEYRESGNQEYFIMIENNLQKRGNWYRLSDIQVIKNDLIDFCFTNWSKLQTRSIIHNRILLDDFHFISDKLHYYNTFREYDFIPIYENITNIDNIKEINKNFFILYYIRLNINILFNKFMAKA